MRVALEHDLAIGCVALDHVGAGADGGIQNPDRLVGRTDGQCGHTHRQYRIGCRGDDVNRLIVDFHNLDLETGKHFGAGVAVQFWVQRLIDGTGDRLGGERRAVTVIDALAQIEAPGSVVYLFPRRRQPRLERTVIGVKLDQRLIDVLANHPTNGRALTVAVVEAVRFFGKYDGDRPLRECRVGRDQHHGHKCSYRHRSVPNRRKWIRDMAILSSLCWHAVGTDQLCSQNFLLCVAGYTSGNQSTRG